MNAKIEPSEIKGTLKAPPSKSMAHRYLICAGLAQGKSVVSGVDFSQDVLATLDCLKELGVDYETDGDKIIFNGKGIVKGKSEYNLKCRESGSTIRFFIPISMMTNGKNVFYGSETLLKRPFSIYEDICKAKNIRFENNGKNIIVEGKLTSGEFALRGDVSSQFITGLMFTLPLLEGDSKIVLTTKVESRSYIELTMEALKKFGVETEWADSQTILVKGNQTYKPCNITVEGDYSNAAYLDAYNMTKGNELELTGLDENSKQGDKVYSKIFDSLKSADSESDLSDCPDLGPIVFAVAAANNGGIFYGTDRLKIKESDRGTVMCEELAKFGIETEMGNNCITIKKGSLKKPEVAVSGHNDHRIVMAMAYLLSITGGTLEGCEAVRKSFPSYFEDMKKVGLKVNS